MDKIEDAIEEEITRGNCKTCPKRFYDKISQQYICVITEEPIGSGDEYCELTSLNY